MFWFTFNTFSNYEMKDEEKKKTLFADAIWNKNFIFEIVRLVQ